MATALCLLFLATPIGLAESAKGKSPAERQPLVSFRNDVMAVLSKAGCNAGTCHGNKHGKGGFKLSLRGEDPAFDHLSLTRDVFARRVDPLKPEQSLMLLKPSTQIAHEGGLRLAPNSAEYDLLYRWISSGMPNDLLSAPKLERIEITPKEKLLPESASEVQLRVRARFSDKSMRDVTSLAVYESANSRVKALPDGLVRRQASGEATVLVRYLHCQQPVRLVFVPKRTGFKWKRVLPNNYIDEHILAKLRKLRMNPSELCSDEVFVRRAYVDLLGIVPTAEEARALLDQSLRSSRRKEALTAASKRETRNKKEDQSLLTSAATQKESLDKRAQLIDQLLERPEFADFWALKWADLLRVEAHSLDPKGVRTFYHWIRESIATNKPLDQFVRELITARGSTYSYAPANYYRPNRDAATRGKAAAQVFLGTRLQCAECHNHPSDRWTQDDYYDWAGLFARVNYKIIENKREIASDEHEWKGEQIVLLAAKGSVKNPRTGNDARPRFLGDTTSLTNQLSLTKSDPLAAVADWLTSPTNTLFARVQVNRIWSHLMGRGLVDPADDFRATNPASHPELLEALAADFVKHAFDVRYLIRLIMNSRAYQLSSEPNETNSDDENNFSHVLERRLGAEQLLDCQSQVTGVPLKFPGYPVGLRAAQLPGVRPESKGKRRASQLDQFLETFGKPPRLVASDTERSCECNMSQVFQMLSGPTVNELLAARDNRVSRLIDSGRSNREILEELFWATLTRTPTQDESVQLLSELESAKDRRAELEDILWGLLNSKDFLFRR